MGTHVYILLCQNVRAVNSTRGLGLLNVYHFQLMDDLALVSLPREPSSQLSEVHGQQN